MIMLMLMLAYVWITGETDETWKPENVEIVSLLLVGEVLIEFIVFLGCISYGVK